MQPCCEKFCAWGPIWFLDFEGLPSSKVVHHGMSWWESCVHRAQRGLLVCALAPCDTAHHPCDFHKSHCQVASDQPVIRVTPQGVEGMSKHLLGTLTAPRTTPAEAQDPIRYLLQLQADGAASLRGQNPVRLYLDTQVRYDSCAADAHNESGDSATRHKTSLLNHSTLTAMRMASFPLLVKAIRCLIA